MGVNMANEIKAQVDEESFLDAFIEETSNKMGSATNNLLNSSLKTWINQAIGHKSLVDQSNNLLEKIQQENTKINELLIVEKGDKNFKLKELAAIDIEIYNNYNILRQNLINAYKFIQDFRKYITGEKIEYLLSQQKGRTIELLTAPFEAIEPSISVAVDDSGKLKLQINNTDELKKLFSPNEEHKGLVNYHKELGGNIYSYLREAKNEIRINNGEQELFGSRWQTGYGVESALGIFAKSKGRTAEKILRSKKDSIWKEYKERQASHAVFYRGGDLNKKEVRKLNLTGVDVNTELQVKRVDGRYGAQLVTLKSIQNTLNIIIIIGENTKGEETAKRYLKVALFKAKQNYGKALLTSLQDTVSDTVFRELKKFIDPSPNK